MISTSALCQFNSDNPPKITITREKKIQKLYDNFCEDQQNRKRFISRVKDILEDSDYYFVDNDYPYHIEPNIKHMICWYKKGNPKHIIENIGKELCVLTYWENLLFNKSIPDINHIHVFINKLK